MNNEVSIKINDIKKEILDEFVYKNPNASIFQTPDMAEVYEMNNGCTPLTLVAINEDTGEIVASLLAKILKEKHGFLSSFSAHSTIRGSPIFLDNEEGIKAVLLLLKHYNKIVAKDVLYSRTYPLNDIPQILPAFKENGYEYEVWNNFLIDINKSKEELWNNLKRDKKRGITKAKKFGIKIHECVDRNQIPIFYDLLRETYVYRQYPLEDISNFEAVFDILVPKNEAKFLFAEYDNKYIAAQLILLYRDTIYAWYTGAIRDYLSYHPTDLLIWHILEWGSKNSFKVFDFGGGGTQDETSDSWVEFKKRFGGKMINYGRYTKIYQPKKLWFAMKMFKIYRRLLLRKW